MPLPDALARFNRVVTNRIARLVADKIPPMAVVVHTGRRTGRRHRTPVLAFPTRRGYAVALTYGENTDWVHNVVDAGGCTIERGGRRFELTDPAVRGASALRLLPPPVRLAVRLLGVHRVLVLERSTSADA